MNQDIFTIHRYEVEYNSTTKPHYLHPFGDVHFKNPQHHVELWREWLDWARAKERSMFIGMGDYVEWFSDSERRGVESINLHQSSKATMDDFAKDMCDEFYKQISFMKGKMLGMLEGNHFYMFQNGMTSTQYLCQKLGCKYLGATGFIRLKFQYENGRKGSKVDIFVHHGKGASRLVGGSLSTVQQMAECAEADIYCVDDETEILTEHGWRKRIKIKKGDIVAGFSMGTGEIEFVPVLEKIEFKYKGKAIRFKNDNINMLLHPKHRVIYKNATSKNWRVREAQDISKMTGQIKIPMCGNSNGTNSPISSHGVKESSLCGWIVSEGTFDVSGIRLTQKYDEKCNLIRKSITECGFEFSEWKRKDGVTQFYIPIRYRKIIDSWLPEKKNIPSWLKFCSDEIFDAFLETLVLGDGSVCGKNTVTVYQSKESFIDDLQCACSVHGRRSSKYFHKGGFKDGGWCLVITKRSTVDIALSRNQATTEDYNGMMWCVSTATHSFVARRDGRTFVTGNCMGHDHKKSIGMSSRLCLTDGRTGIHLKEKKILYVGTGSFLKGYDPDKPSYVAKSLLNPTNLGTVKIELTPKNRKNKRDGKVINDSQYVDIHASL
jgi:hypothetical protein